MYICWCPRLGGALVALAIAQQALVEAVAASTLMINHRLWSPADAAPRPTAAYSISQSKPKLLLPEFDILQMVPSLDSLANYRIGGGGSTKAERSGPRLNLAELGQIFRKTAAKTGPWFELIGF